MSGLVVLYIAQLRWNPYVIHALPCCVLQEPSEIDLKNFTDDNSKLHIIVYNYAKNTN